MDPRGNMILTYQWGLGRATNNIAKIYALYLGLDFTVSMGIQNIQVIGDSLLIISQTCKRGQLDDRIVGRIHDCIVDLLREIKEVKRMHVRRNNNTISDRLANQASNLGRGKLVKNGGECNRCLA